MPEYLDTPTTTIASPTANRIREQSMATGLHRAALPPDPLTQFERWYQEATAAALPEPNAMTLATVDAAGQPWVRTVLLKLYDAAGFVFFTNYHSNKAQQLATNPQVALLFPWLALARQVQITGTAARISTAESLRYFMTRPRGSQIGAWASPQSQVITSRALLENKVAEMAAKFAHGEVPLPEFWGGYRVTPTRIEFWQGRDSRLHDRLCYTRTNAAADWHIARLAP